MKLQLDALAGLEGAMEFHRDRHVVLAGNLANLDTPAFAPFDLVPQRTAGPNGDIARTHARHLAIEGPAAGREVVIDPSSAPRRDGNQVSLERELAKIDANRVRYLTSSKLVSRRLALLRYAAGDGV